MTTASNMLPYSNLLRHIIDTGTDLKNERTGEICRYVVSAKLEFNLSDGFPVPTQRRFSFKSCLGELLGFFRGYTNAVDFESVGSKVWYANANETKAWLANPYRQGQENENGRIYGVQWNSWRDSRIADTQEERDRLLSLGYEIEVEGVDKWAMVRYINQLENALRTILTNPSDRRIIVSGWNVAELDMMSLPPCHHTYTFVCNPDGTLDIECCMRSWDTVLAFNIQLTAIFLHIMARLSGRRPGRVFLQATNAHIYGHHFDGAELMLSRSHYDAPELILSDSIEAVKSLDDIPGIFQRIEPEYIWLEGYESHEAIKFRMSA